MPAETDGSFSESMAMRWRRTVLTNEVDSPRCPVDAGPDGQRVDEDETAGRLDAHHRYAERAHELSVPGPLDLRLKRDISRTVSA